LGKVFSIFVFKKGRYPIPEKPKESRSKRKTKKINQAIQRKTNKIQKSEKPKNKNIQIV
jgi:hypothetical protein